MWQALTIGGLWQHAMAAIPFILLVALVTRVVRCRPATRHTLWVCAMLWMVLAPFLPQAPTLSLMVDTPEAPPASRAAPDAHVDRSVTSARLSRAHPMTRTRFQARRTTPALHRAGDLPSTTEAAEVEHRLTELGVNEKKQPEKLEKPGSRMVEIPPPSSQRSVARPRSSSESDAPLRLAQATGLGGPLAINTDAPSGAEDISRATDDAAPQLADIASYDGSWEPTLPPIAPVDDFPYLLTGANFVNGGHPGPASSNVPAVQTVSHKLQTWVLGMGAVGDAILNLPPIPSEMWIGGGLLIICIGLIRILRSRSLISAARPAPVDIRRLVKNIARDMGLRTIPETLIVKHRTSPMVWCGRRLRLVIPMSLWLDLDEAGRRAVIVHELAHLRRRDHWVSWLGMFVGVLYWWYPLVWWVRSRVNAEAEHCCDAWVTTLLPKGRRAYAVALLKAKQHAFESDSFVPAVGIRVTTGQAGRFARRLSMVMTQNVKPRLSMPGVALVASVALAGWFVSPARSCPNEKKEGAVKANTVTVTAAPAVAFGQAHGAAVVAVPCRDCPKGKPCKDCRGVTGIGVSTVGPCDADCPCAKHAKKKVKAKAKSRVKVYARSDGRSHDGDDDDDDCCTGQAKAYVVGVGPSDCCADADDCCPEAKAFGLGGKIAGGLAYAIGQQPPVHRVPPVFAAPGLAGKGGFRFAAAGADDKEVDARIKRLEKRLERLGDQLERLSRSLERRSERAERPRREREPREPRAAREPREPRQAREPREPRAPRAPRAPRSPMSPRGPKALKAPPMRVPPPLHEHENEADNDETVIRTYSLPKGKLEALSELMVRSDVPVLVRPLDEGIEVHGTEAQQRVFAAFVKLINPKDDGRSDADAPELSERFAGLAVNEKLAAELAERAAHMAQAARSAREEYAERVEQHQQQIEMAAHQYHEANELRELQVRQRALQRQVEELERGADRMRESAENIRDKANDLREKANEQREQADSLRQEAQNTDDANARKEQLAKVEQLIARADGLTKGADDLQQQADRLESQAQQLQQQADSIERQADQLGDRVENHNGDDDHSDADNDDDNDDE